MSRTKEVGLRKTIGASRYQLTFQFLFESILLTFLALIIALLISISALPFFGGLIDRPLSLDISALISITPYLIGLVLVLGVISGSYPALFMSRLRPIRALKGESSGQSGNRIQKWLIAMQYTISSAMIICTLAANEQFDYVREKDLGYDKSQVLTIRTRSHELRHNYEILRNEWLQNPSILAVSGSQDLPIDINQATIVNDDKGGDPMDDLPIYQLRTDYDFLDLYDVELLAGRNFSRDFNDSLNVCIINEAAAKVMGWTPEEAVGKVFTEDSRIRQRRIIGVVKDFHIHSMHLEIEPLLLERRETRFNRFISIKVKPENIQETLIYLEESVGKYSDYPFECEFLDDRYDLLYKEDARQSKIFNFFTGLTVLIASFGLFGLAAYTMRTRLKEVSIRKVLGASTTNIIALMSSSFMKLTFIGFLISAPIAWYLIDSWLQSFSYHAEVQWWVYVFAGFISLLISFSTVSIQSVKAALTNPAEILQDE